MPSSSRRAVRTCSLACAAMLGPLREHDLAPIAPVDHFLSYPLPLAARPAPVETYAYALVTFFPVP